jgi:hypothetical protein
MSMCCFTTGGHKLAAVNDVHLCVHRYVLTLDVIYVVYSIGIEYSTAHTCTLARYPPAVRSIQLASYSFGPVVCNSGNSGNSEHGFVIQQGQSYTLHHAVVVDSSYSNSCT